MTSNHKTLDTLFLLNHGFGRSPSLLRRGPQLPVSATQSNTFTLWIESYNWIGTAINKQLDIRQAADIEAVFP